MLIIKFYAYSPNWERVLNKFVSKSAVHNNFIFRKRPHKKPWQQAGKVRVKWKWNTFKKKIYIYR